MAKEKKLHSAKLESQNKMEAMFVVSNSKLGLQKESYWQPQTKNEILFKDQVNKESLPAIVKLCVCEGNPNKVTIDFQDFDLFSTVMLDVVVRYKFYFKAHNKMGVHHYTEISWSRKVTRTKTRSNLQSQNMLHQLLGILLLQTSARPQPFFLHVLSIVRCSKARHSLCILKCNVTNVEN